MRYLQFILILTLMFCFSPLLSGRFDKAYNILSQSYPYMGTLKGVSHALTMAAIANSAFGKKCWFSERLYLLGVGSTLTTLLLRNVLPTDKEKNAYLLSSLSTLLGITVWYSVKNTKTNYYA